MDKKSENWEKNQEELLDSFFQAKRKYNISVAFIAFQDELLKIDFSRLPLETLLELFCIAYIGGSNNFREKISESIRSYYLQEINFVLEKITERPIGHKMKRRSIKRELFKLIKANEKITSFDDFKIVCSACKEILEKSAFFNAFSFVSGFEDALFILSSWAWNENDQKEESAFLFNSVLSFTSSFSDYFQLFIALIQKRWSYAETVLKQMDRKEFQEGWEELSVRAEEENYTWNCFLFCSDAGGFLEKSKIIFLETWIQRTNNLKFFLFLQRMLRIPAEDVLLVKNVGSDRLVCLQKRVDDKIIEHEDCSFDKAFQIFTNNIVSKSNYCIANTAHKGQIVHYSTGYNLSKTEYKKRFICCATKARKIEEKFSLLLFVASKKSSFSRREKKKLMEFLSKEVLNGFFSFQDMLKGLDFLLKHPDLFSKKDYQLLSHRFFTILPQQMKNADDYFQAYLVWPEGKEKNGFWEKAWEKAEEKDIDIWMDKTLSCAENFLKKLLFKYPQYIHKKPLSFLLFPFCSTNEREMIFKEKAKGGTKIEELFKIFEESKNEETRLLARERIKKVIQEKTPI